MEGADSTRIKAQARRMTLLTNEHHHMSTKGTRRPFKSNWPRRIL